ncbi:hypothetical protein TruAng_006993 [Truncatella angustata]|nr:hypothetical protein TruAng_006993 [Truncatella angustata]
MILENKTVDTYEIEETIVLAPSPQHLKHDDAQASASEESSTVSSTFSVEDALSLHDSVTRIVNIGNCGDKIPPGLLTQAVNVRIMRVGVNYSSLPDVDTIGRQLMKAADDMDNIAERFEAFTVEIYSMGLFLTLYVLS